MQECIERTSNLLQYILLLMLQSRGDRHMLIHSNILRQKISELPSICTFKQTKQILLFLFKQQ